MTDSTSDGRTIRRGIVLPNWEAGTDVELLVALAVAAEGAGWDGVFLADHLIFPPPRTIGGRADPAAARPFPDPWITLAGIAARTERITLGSWITPLARRQPWQVARDVATLDRLSGGRVILGVGLGRRPDYEAFGHPWDPPAIGRRLDEALEVVAGLWSGEPFSYSGEHFTVEETVVLPTPLQRPRVPIVAGGIWPNERPLRRGARWDGIVPHYAGDGVVPGDGTPPEDHVRDLVDSYQGMTDDPGEVILHEPSGSSPAFLEACHDAGVTWLLTGKREGAWSLDPDRVRAGPPSR